MNNNNEIKLTENKLIFENDAIEYISSNKKLLFRRY